MCQPWKQYHKKDQKRSCIWQMDRAFPGCQRCPSRSLYKKELGWGRGWELQKELGHKQTESFFWEFYLHLEGRALYYHVLIVSLSYLAHFFLSFFPFFFFFWDSKTNTLSSFPWFKTYHSRSLEQSRYILRGNYLFLFLKLFKDIREFIKQHFILHFQWFNIPLPREPQFWLRIIRPFPLHPPPNFSLIWLFLCLLVSLAGSRKQDQGWSKLICFQALYTFYKTRWNSRGKVVNFPLSVLLCRITWKKKKSHLRTLVCPQ